MRIASKIDVNQPQIVQAFRRMGARVQVLSNVGKGFPDLLILFQGKLALVEVKDGEKAKSKRRLTPDEKEWHDQWYDAPLFIVESVDDAVMVLEKLGDE